ncbi:hypothetical protein Bca101_066174 [Brassica carinata]
MSSKKYLQRNWASWESGVFSVHLGSHDSALVHRKSPVDHMSWAHKPNSSLKEQEPNFPSDFLIVSVSRSIAIRLDQISATSKLQHL